MRKTNRNFFTNTTILLLLLLLRLFSGRIQLVRLQSVIEASERVCSSSSSSNNSFPSRLLCHGKIVHHFFVVTTTNNNNTVFIVNIAITMVAQRRFKHIFVAKMEISLQFSKYSSQNYTLDTRQHGNKSHSSVSTHNTTRHRQENRSVSLFYLVFILLAPPPLSLLLLSSYFNSDSVLCLFFSLKRYRFRDISRVSFVSVAFSLILFHPK